MCIQYIKLPLPVVLETGWCVWYALALLRTLGAALLCYHLGSRHSLPLCKEVWKDATLREELLHTLRNDARQTGLSQVSMLLCLFPFVSVYTGSQYEGDCVWWELWLASEASLWLVVLWCVCGIAVRLEKGWVRCVLAGCMVWLMSGWCLIAADVGAVRIPATPTMRSAKRAYRSAAMRYSEFVQLDTDALQQIRAFRRVYYHLREAAEGYTLPLAIVAAVLAITVFMMLKRPETKQTTLKRLLRPIQLLEERLCGKRVEASVLRLVHSIEAVGGFANAGRDGFPVSAADALQCLAMSEVCEEEAFRRLVDGATRAQRSRRAHRTLAVSYVFINTDAEARVRVQEVLRTVPSASTVATPASASASASEPTVASASPVVPTPAPPSPLTPPLAVPAFASTSASPDVPEPVSPSEVAEKNTSGGGGSSGGTSGCADPVRMQLVSLLASLAQHRLQEIPSPSHTLALQRVVADAVSQEQDGATLPHTLRALRESVVLEVCFVVVVVLFLHYTVT